MLVASYDLPQILGARRAGDNRATTNMAEQSFPMLPGNYALGVYGVDDAHGGLCQFLRHQKSHLLWGRHR